MNKILAFFLVLMVSSCMDKPVDSPLLHRFASFENRFRFFFEDAEKWTEGVYRDSTFINNETSMPIANTKIFVVSYRNGDFIYKRGDAPSLPEDVQTDIILDEDFSKKSFPKEALETGAEWCEVIHEKSPVFKYQKNYHQTRLTNISNEKIKVLRMGYFVKIPNNQYQLFTPERKYYTAENFRTWYTEDDSEWIAPGTSVFDPVNRSNKDTLWAYHIESESGEKYWVSKLYKKE